MMEKKMEATIVYRGVRVEDSGFGVQGLRDLGV